MTSTVNPEFLSQSHLKDIDLCEEKYRLMYIAGNGGGEHGFQMAREVGTAFDVYVKNMIDPSQKIEFPDWPEGSADHTEARRRGLYIARLYKQCGALEKFNDLGIHIIPRMKKVITYDGIQIPLAGSLDIIKSNGDPADFKVSGAGSKASLKPGYKYSFKMRLGKIEFHKAPHERCGIPMEEINEDWALQQVIYNLLCGKQPNQPMRAHIEMAAVRGEVVDFGTYDAPISPWYVEKVLKLAADKWRRIQARTFDPPFYQEYKCDKYFAKVCPVAHLCSGYNNRPSVDKVADLSWLDR